MGVRVGPVGMPRCGVMAVRVGLAGLGVMGLVGPVGPVGAAGWSMARVALVGPAGPGMPPAVVVGPAGPVERPRCGVVVVMGALVGWVAGMGGTAVPGAGCWVVGAPAATAG